MFAEIFFEAFLNMYYVMPSRTYFRFLRIFVRIRVKKESLQDFDGL
jgi:hypothetical protein